MNPRKQINNIYGYVRVSSEQQVKDGSSLDEQKRSIEEFVANKFGGRQVDQFFTDAGISGMKPLLERPGSRELTDTMDANDVIVVTKLDSYEKIYPAYQKALKEGGLHILVEYPELYYD